MISRAILSLFAMAALCACANLKVHTDILNPVETRRVAEDARLAALYYDIVKADDQTIHNRVAKLRDSHIEANSGLSEAYRQAAGQAGLANGEKGLLEQAADDLDGQFEDGGTLKDLYARYEAALFARRLAVLTEAGKAPVGANSALPPSLRAVILNGDIEVRTIEGAIRADLTDSERTAEKTVARLKQAEAATPPPNASTAAKAQATATAAAAGKAADKANEGAQKVRIASRSISEAMNTATGSRSLAASEYAFAVVSAAPEAWAPNLNIARGRAFMGNSDIVIKLDNTGEFTVKGMQFDPGTVAEVASKVTTQSLLLAAKLAGVPVGASAISDTNKKNVGLVGTGDDARTRDDDLLKRQAVIEAHDQAIRNLALAVMSEQPQIRGTEQQRKTAGDAIFGEFEAYSKMIKMDTLN